MTNKSKLLIAILLVALAGGIFFSPHFAVNAMKSAAEARDAAKFSGYVNYPALKESLKASFNAKLASEAMKDKGGQPNAALGAALAAAIINPMIDALVTPESLAVMMSGDQPQPGKSATAPSPTRTTVAKDDTSERSLMAYERFDRFVVTVKNKGNASETVGFVFNRDGLFSWKLSAIRLPL